MKNHAGRPLEGAAATKVEEKVEPVKEKVVTKPVAKPKEETFAKEASQTVLNLMTTHTRLSELGMKNKCTYLHLAIERLGEAMTALGRSGRESEKTV